MPSRSEPRFRSAWREITARLRPARRRAVAAPVPAGAVARVLGAPPDALERLRGADVTVVGAGVVNAALVELLPALGPGTVRIVDPDRYAPGNVRSQPVTPGAIGRPKCEVVGERLKARSPETRVLVAACRYEELALADLHDSGAVFLGGDALALTLAVSARACALGQALIEGSVHAATCVAQVRRTLPAAGRARACPVCTWDAGERRELEHQTRFACDGSGRPLTNPGGPTGALSALGSLAASLMAFELLPWLLGRDDGDAIVEHCALSRSTVVAPLLPNPRCPVDHSAWRRVRSHRPLAELGPAQILALAGAGARGSLEVEGARWVSRALCECAEHPVVDRFVGLAAEAESLGACARCGSTLRPHAFHSHVQAPGGVFAAYGDRPLAALGAQGARVAVVRGSSTVTLVVGPEPPAGRVAPGQGGGSGRLARVEAAR